jgi:2-phospho-L-lactate/phosphoenolpyruvate guanylyltransferase
MTSKIFAIIPVSKFSKAKTRLSPTLTFNERENLLKAMLTDVIKNIVDLVDNVVVISPDKDVLEFVQRLGVIPLKEKQIEDLNKALTQAIEYCSKFCEKVLIIPSDVPLIQKNHVKEILDKGKNFDIVIAPSKGGGTNAILFSPKNIDMKFGVYSFFEHIKQAKIKEISYDIYDSFYLSLDVNTAEDLGEILLHGIGTETQQFLKQSKFKVRSNHGSERLDVEREV